MSNVSNESSQSRTDTPVAPPNEGGVSEETVVHTLDLPEGQDFVVFADCNIVGLSSRLDEAGRERALIEAGIR